MLANAETKLPQLEWVLVQLPCPEDELQQREGLSAYWALERLGRFHNLYRRRGSALRNTLGGSQHPPEWREAIEYEIAKSPEWYKQIAN